MGEWRRETPWRQGHILPEDAFHTLFLSARDNGFDIAVVISHDCDLAQTPDAEPMVELIIGKRIDKLDGNYSYAKSARRLHLSFTKSGSSLCIDIGVLQKVDLEKSRLAGYAPDRAARLTANELSILQRWLAARYRRSAFPDEFDHRLADAGVPERLAKMLKPHGSVIVAMYFDVDRGEEISRDGEDDPYALLIYLLYSERDDAKSSDKAEGVAREIENLFRKNFFNQATQTWRNIELEGCEPISDEAMTYAQSAKLKRWNGDYISLRADPQQLLPED